MNVTTQLYLLRHGETEWSLTGQHTSRTDLSLTLKGEKQALQLGEILRGIKFSQVLTSPLQRARMTCDLAAVSNAGRVEQDLHEWDYGAFEGLTTEEIHARQPDWNIFENGCPDGETVDQITRRADRVLSHVRSIRGTVALFSHGHFLRALAARWLVCPVLLGRYFALDTGSVSILDYEHADQKLPVILRWNSVAETP